MSTEHGILFSQAMVKAILDGSKTQTRRVLVPKPGPEYWPVANRVAGDRDAVFLREGRPSSQREELRIRCRYGRVGDRLWVREAWRPWWDEELYCCVQFRDRTVRKPGLHKGHDIPDENVGFNFAGWCDAAPNVKWRPSIYMPRWASRITLELTDIRVEQLQDISESDARAEGATEELVAPGDRGSFIDGYYWLWDSINAKRPGCSWTDNPWVFALSFRRVDEGPMFQSASPATAVCKEGE